ncbi:TetR/AcrR family transcriptional regulator [Marinobacter sp.]|uniref:TetR/AcrR family transcriptional regulator n=1 Tax=Marinobacter sp. TaxID=50741 RepID=UPI00384AE7F6
MGRIAKYDRDDALDRAIGLFWEKGYFGSSMKQIEQSLDMRPGSLYATFGSKEGLFGEAMARYAEHGGAEMAGHLAGYDSVLDGLQDYLRNLAKTFSPDAQAPSRACLIIKTLLEVSHTDSGLSRQANALIDGIESSLTAVLEQASQKGELKPDADCARLARLIQAQIIGLRSFAQRDTSAEHVVQLGEDMASMLEGWRAGR